MSTNERHQVIAEKVDTTGSATVADLARELGASEATIRRDLVEMDRAGLLRRTHGGAVRLSLRGREPAFIRRATENGNAKTNIAVAAAALLTPGETVALDSGTTCVEVARQLVPLHLRVVPMSLPAMEILARSTTVTMTSPGGDLRPAELSYVGPMAESNLARLRFDTALISCCGISLTNGVTAYDLSDASIKNVAIRHAQRKIVLCDDSKWEITTFALIDELRIFDVLVTDHQPTPEEQQFFSDNEIDVITV
ncbi:DeoR/GlpR transcriptional regulator [Nakamurella silvestris]|nr:DeoR/GlpR transcriptional regulator [Nakamurella silvestris]